MTNEGDDIAVYPEVSVILNIVKDPALGRRGALALLATKGRFISPRGVCFSTIAFRVPKEYEAFGESHVAAPLLGG